MFGTDSLPSKKNAPTNRQFGMKAMIFLLLQRCFSLLLADEFKIAEELGFGTPCAHWVVSPSHFEVKQRPFYYPYHPWDWYIYLHEMREIPSHSAG